MSIILFIKHLAVGIEQIVLNYLAVGLTHVALIIVSCISNLHVDTNMKYNISDDTINNSYLTF
jgi:hypothetical protein